MTEEEKKEFEEFLQWKKDRDAQKQHSESNSETKSELKSKTGHEELKENSENNKSHNAEENTNTSSTDWVKNVQAVILAVLFIILFLIFMVSMPKCSAPKTLDGKIDSVAEDTVVALAVAPISSKPSVVTWDIISRQDEMTDSKNIWAEIKSDNYICQDFPYDGLTYATITVRYMKKYGYDVLIQITKGQIDGRKYYGTDYITARFDDGQPKKYYFNESADGSSEVVFLRNKTDFITRCKKSKDIKIDIPIYQSGRPVFTFHVDEPLVWPKE